jgi:hypothetical protein
MHSFTDKNNPIVSPTIASTFLFFDLYFTTSFFLFHLSVLENNTPSVGFPSLISRPASKLYIRCLERNCTIGSNVIADLRGSKILYSNFASQQTKL